MMRSVTAAALLAGLVRAQSVSVIVTNGVTTTLTLPTFPVLSPTTTVTVVTTVPTATTTVYVGSDSDDGTSTVTTSTGTATVTVIPGKSCTSPFPKSIRKQPILTNPPPKAQPSPQQP
jgi:hypothetical protein